MTDNVAELTRNKLIELRDQYEQARTQHTHMASANEGAMQALDALLDDYFTDAPLLEEETGEKVIIDE